MPKEKNILHWIMMFVLIHMSSGASTIALSDLALAIFSVATLVLFLMRKLRFDKPFLVFTWIYIVILAFYFMNFGWVNFTASIRIYLKIIYAYATIKIVGYYFFQYFSDIVAKLAMISLPLFLIQYFLPDQMMAWNGFLEFIIPQVPKGGYEYANSLVFTVNPWGLERNSGFMWEPGAFAAMLSVAMFINLIVHRSKLNRDLLIMLIAMFTTFSTTGYLLIMLLGLFYLLNKPTTHIAIGTPILIILAIAVYSHPEVSEKIANRISNSGHSIESAENYEGESNGISVGRFGSLLLDMDDLQKQPILGFGLQATERISGRYADLVRANGFSDYLVKFGILGMVFLIFALSKSFSILRAEFGGRAYILGTLIILTLSFSNPLLVSPLFFGFQFYYMAIRFSSQIPTLANA